VRVRAATRPPSACTPDTASQGQASAGAVVCVVLVAHSPAAMEPRRSVLVLALAVAAVLSVAGRSVPGPHPVSNGSVRVRACVRAVR
jgi:hypothetical protein